MMSAGPRGAFAGLAFVSACGLPAAGSSARTVAATDSAHASSPANAGMSLDVRLIPAAPLQLVLQLFLDQLLGLGAMLAEIVVELLEDAGARAELGLETLEVLVGDLADVVLELEVLEALEHGFLLVEQLGRLRMALALVNERVVRCHRTASAGSPRGS